MYNPITSAWSWWWDISNETDEDHRKFLTALTPLLVILCFVCILNKKDTPLPPGPCGLPIVGYLPFLGSDLRLTFKDLASRYGPIFKVRLGSKECVVVSSPSLVKEVLKDQDVIFANRDPTVAARIATFGAPDIAFSDYSPEWRKMRKIFAGEMLSNASLDASNRLRKQVLQKMISDTYIKAGDLVDIGELIFVTTMSSVLGMIWGETLEGDDGAAINLEFRAVIAEFMQLLGAPNISDYIPWLARFDIQGLARRMKLVSTKYEKVFDAAINHQTTGEQHKLKGFLGHLLQLTKNEDPATPLTLSQLKAILMDVVFGGIDTTFTTIEWAMAELLQHPQAMRNAQIELTEVVGLNNMVQEAHLTKLTYLKAVFKETLRLHPPVPLLIPHRSSKSTIVGGYIIPKDSQVFVNAWAIQRDPQHWEAPSTFRPERFMSVYPAEKMDLLGSNLQYLPFGSGRRICPGMILADKAVMHVLAVLLHSFEWILPDGTIEVDLSEIFGIVVRKSKPLIAVPSPRLSNLELYSAED